ERWIMASRAQTQREVERLLGEFDFSHTVGELYHLTFDDFCDWYAEAVKGRLYEGDEDARATAVAALERLLELLHPALPHVTEEIWASLPARQTRLIVAPWPVAGDEAEAGALTEVQEAAVMFRRSGVLPKLEGEERRIFDAVVKPAEGSGDGNAAAEIERLQKEISRAEGMLANDRFTQNAPAEVVEAEREKLARYRRELDAISRWLCRVSVPGAQGRLRARADQGAPRKSRRSAASGSIDSRRRGERRVDRDSHDRS